MGDGKRPSISLPASPSFRRRAVSADPQQEQCESPSKSPLSFDSMLKNFEEFAQHQWPTWAKRRGWIADTETVNPSIVAADDGSGRVIQVNKDKWIFLRPRKKCASSISPIVRVYYYYILCNLMSYKEFFSLLIKGCH